MAEVVDDPLQELHTQVHLKWIPFLVRLLSGQPAGTQGDPIPQEDETALTQEAVKTVCELSNHAVWRFLSKECGWNAEAAPAITETGWRTKGRLWQEGRIKLTFSSAIFELLLGAYNRAVDPQAEVRIPAPDNPNGDVLLTFLVFRGAVTCKPIRMMDDGELALWLDNPLIALWAGERFGSMVEGVAWERLLEPDLRPALPWILQWMGREWTKQARGLWETRKLSTIAAWYEARYAAVEGLIRVATASGQVDLLKFLLGVLAREAEYFDEAEVVFRQRTEGLRLSDRQAASRAWIDFLELRESLRREHAAIRSEHPIDREPAGAAFLDAFESLGFIETSDHLRRCQDRLTPSIG